MDFSEMLQAQNQELRRLVWTNEQGQKYIRKTYNKIHRLYLTDEEMMDFLDYLKSLPTP